MAAMTPQEYIIEEWTRYGIAVSIMLLRFSVRLTMTGWRNFDGTDFWCALALVSWPFSH
jgi:hypothetical protein